MFFENLFCIVHINKKRTAETYRSGKTRTIHVAPRPGDLSTGRVARKDRYDRSRFLILL